MNNTFLKKDYISSLEEYPVTTLSTKEDRVSILSMSKFI